MSKEIEVVLKKLVGNYQRRARKVKEAVSKIKTMERKAPLQPKTKRAFPARR